MDLESQLTQQVTAFAYVMFAYMQRSGNWGDAGQAQVEDSFCRCVMGLLPMDAVSQDVLFAFRKKVAQELVWRGLDQLSTEELRDRLDAFSFSLDGKPYRFEQADEINKLLQESNSNYVLQSGFYGDSVECIWALGRREQVGRYLILHIEHEVVRTPNVIVGMAAAISGTDIFIRKQALETIFEYKWRLPFEHRLYLDERKTRVVENYEGIGRDVFLEEMAETVLAHELGHGVSQDGYLDMVACAVGEASRVFGENALTVIHELLADLAPEKEGVRGPLLNMADVGVNDPAKAARLYWMYVSDTWFFDTGDTYMYVYSHCISKIMGHAFLESENRVDCSRIPFELFDRLVVLYHDMVTEFQVACPTVSFEIADLDHTEFTKHLIDQFVAISKDPAHLAKIQALLTEQEQRLLAAVSHSL